MLMRFFVALLACAAAGNLARAADPPAGPAIPTAAAGVSTPATAATATAAASAAQPAAAAKPAAPAAEQVDPKEKHFLAEGYALEMHHGNKLFCRREEQMGTRLGAHKVCSTAEQLTATERDAQRAMERPMMPQNNPTGR
jgi:hypothetical protein